MESYSPARWRRRYSGLLLVVVASGCAISTQREVELGQDFSAQVNRQLPLVRDAESLRYLRLLGDSLARLADDRNLDWHFYLVDSREVNAFAAPGGHVWVNRGLIERTTNMAQLAGVLAHEIAHVTHRHSVEQMQTAQRANVGLTLACILTRVCEHQATSTAVQLGGSALFARFSRDDEAESDRAAVDYLVRAGIDPRGIPQMFRILLRERAQRPGGLQALFATHPLEEDRVRATESVISRLPASALRGVRADSPRYQQFRQRVASLPTVAGR